MKRHFLFLVSLLLLSLSGTGCGLLNIPATATPTEIPTTTLAPLPSATIDWFPATPTAGRTPIKTPLPLPTPELGLAEIILADGFAPSEAWELPRTTSGTASLSEGVLTLAVQAEKGYLTSLRVEPQLSDFYLEVTAATSLCRQGDSYGLLLRAASTGDTYRWVITCDGQTRLERVRGGFASLVHDWVYSAQIRPGAPAEHLLGVWMAGPEMRFFINGVEQFTAREPVFTSGGIGFFARATADSPVTVRFSVLSVRAVDTRLLPTKTPMP